MTINQVVLAGNMTRPVELKYAQSGTAYAKIGIAVNDSYKNNNTGEWVERAHFFDVTCFGKLAERVAQLEKGNAILVTGKLTYNQWTDDSGQKRSKVEVTADNVQRLQFLKNPDSQHPQPQQYQQPPQQSHQQPQPQPQASGEDIPF